MVRQKPELRLALLEAADAALPNAATTVVVSESLSALVPDYRADCVVALRDAMGGLARIVVVEVQLHRAAQKLFALPVYQALARARYGVPCEVLVVAPRPAVARWLRAPVALGGGSIFRAQVLGPEELGALSHAATAEVAFLRAMVRGDHEPALVVEAAERFDELPAERGALYLDLLLRLLSRATRHTVEALMPLSNYEFKSEYMLKVLARGREEGRQEGRQEGLEGLRQAIRAVIDARGLTLRPEDARRLAACTELATLGEWARRAAVASRVEAIFDAPADDR